MKMQDMQKKCLMTNLQKKKIMINYYLDLPRVYGFKQLILNVNL